VAKDRWREEFAEQGFVPHGEVVRLRRQCWLAWALVVVVLIVVLGRMIDVSTSFHNEVASPRAISADTRFGNLSGPSMPALHKLPELGLPHWVRFY
jgi:putative exporter of polyketide antibiotics